MVKETIIIYGGVSVPTIEQIYDKLCLLETQLTSMRDGFALSDDMVVDFFNLDTLPGREAENARIESLDNVSIQNGSATIIDPLLDEGFLQTATTQLDVSDIQSVELRPHDEDVQCQVVITPNSVQHEHYETWLSLVTTDALSVEVVPDTGQRDYGAKLQLESNDSPYLVRNDFVDGDLHQVWFPEKSSVVWTTVNVGSGGVYDYILRCQATEPLFQFPLPQYSLARYGMALWSDVLLKSTNGIATSFKQTSGGLFNVGLLLNMSNALDGLLLMMESDLNGSWVRLYKSTSGMLELITEQAMTFAWALGVDYEANVTLINNEIVLLVDGTSIFQYTLDYFNQVEPGEFGVVVKATAEVDFAWIQVAGIFHPVFVAPDGEVLTELYTSGSDIETWGQIEIDTSIVSGEISIEYSLDDITYLPVPMATIQYPGAITKRFNIDSIPVNPGVNNNIRFKIKMHETGVGWVRRVLVTYNAIATPVYALNNMFVSQDGFRLNPGELSGSVEMLHDIEPDQIYYWEKVISDEYRAANFVPIASILNQATVTVDSEQVPHTGDLIVDNDMGSYWESMRGDGSYVIFDFPSPVEIYGFRWIKKSLTEGAVYYHAQYFDAVQNAFVDIHNYGYEVNNDIRHDFPTPVKCQRFRIYIDCVQPMSFGNARFIDIFGRTLGGRVEINYEYSIDSGATWVAISGLLTLHDVLPEQNLRLRAMVEREDPLSDVFLRSFGVRFAGRDSAGIQLTDIKYSVQLGDRSITDMDINTELDMRGVLGSSFALNAHFIVNPNYAHEMLKPVLGGYRFMVSSSKYQTQIDFLRNHIYSVLYRADRDPLRDELADAVIMLIGHELDKERQSNGEEGSIIHGLLNVLQKEISRLNSQMVAGDTGHLDEALPNIVRRANLLD